MKFSFRLRFAVLAMASVSLLTLLLPVRTDAKGVGQPVVRRWNPCAELQWKIHQDVDKATHRSVKRSMAEFARAVGRRFSFAGVASDEEFAGPPVDTLVIGFDSSLAGGRIAGLTSLWYRSEIDGVKTISGARISLNPQVRSRSRSTFPELTPVLLHELGHVAGLDHVDDPSDLMFPHIVNVRSYRQRDVELLRRQAGGTVCPSGVGTSLR
jgi:hypothetical protein